ncbi:MAG: hypothetical protein ABIE22_02750 [archaeon]
MKFDHYLNRALGSKEFKKFQKANEKAYLCAGFFVLDFESGKDMHQIDFYIPANKKIATFNLQEGVQCKVTDGTVKKKPKVLEGDIKTDLEQLKGIVTDVMHNHNVTQEVKKIIAVIQNIEGKNTWVLNCITDGLGLVKVNIDDADESLLKFEKANLMDFIKRVK